MEVAIASMSELLHREGVAAPGAAVETAAAPLG
jgi:hypothetical protein